MVKILHGDHAAQIAEHEHTVVGAGIGRSVAEWRHFIGIIVESIKTLHALSGGGHGRALADRVHPNLVLRTEVVAKATGKTFQEGLAFGHFAVIGEDALRGDVTQTENAAPVAHSVALVERLHQAVERHGADVKGLLHPLVLDVGVRAFFAHVERHSDGVQHEVDLSPEMLLGFVHEFFQVLVAGGIRADDLGIELLGELIELPEAKGYRGIAQRDLRPFGDTAFGYFPGNALFVEGTGNDAALSG